MSSTIVYCNSLKYGCAKNLLNKLKKMQNCAARVVTGVKKFDHVKPTLESLSPCCIKNRVQVCPPYLQMFEWISFTVSNRSPSTINQFKTTEVLQ